HLVLGIGLNVNQAAFPEQVSALAASLRMETGRAHDLAEVREAVLAALDHRYACFLATGVEGLREAWLEGPQRIGGRARGGEAGDGPRGVAVALADDGALVVRMEDGETVRILAGDVTMEAADAAR